MHAQMDGHQDFVEGEQIELPRPPPHIAEAVALRALTGHTGEAQRHVHKRAQSGGATSRAQGDTQHKRAHTDLEEPRAEKRRENVHAARLGHIVALPLRLLQDATKSATDACGTAVNVRAHPVSARFCPAFFLAHLAPCDPPS